MCALFRSGKTVPLHREAMEVPELRDGQLAATSYWPPLGGVSYDFVRVSPTRVLFGLLDVAGRVDDIRAIVSAAQKTFRTLGAELLSGQDTNEADAMIELCIGLNRTIL